jgi:hypothetical protein
MSSSRTIAIICLMARVLKLNRRENRGDRRASSEEIDRAFGCCSLDPEQPSGSAVCLDPYEIGSLLTYHQICIGCRV